MERRPICVTRQLGIGLTRQMVWVLGNRAYIARVRIDHFENISNRMAGYGF